MEKLQNAKSILKSVAVFSALLVLGCPNFDVTGDWSIVRLITDDAGGELVATSQATFGADGIMIWYDVFIGDGTGDAMTYVSNGFSVRFFGEYERVDADGISQIVVDCDLTFTGQDSLTGSCVDSFWRNEVFLGTLHSTIDLVRLGSWKVLGRDH